MFNTFIILTLFVVLSRQDHEESLDIVELNATSFKSTISQYKTSSVLFFAPWCGHCKLIMPEYEQTCKEINALFPGDVLCARLDCTKNEAICAEHQLQGYPTLKIIRESYECVYNGGRVKENILNWIKSAHNSINEVNDIKELKELFESYKNKTCLIGYFNNATHPMRKLIEELICNMPTINALVTSNQEFGKEHALKNENSLYLFQEGKNTHQIEKVENISALITTLFFFLNPLVPEYDQQNFHVVFNQGVAKYVAFVYNKSEELANVKDVLELFAKEHFGRVRVFTIDASNESNMNIVEYFKLKKLPNVVHYDDEIQRFFHFEKESEISLPILNEFLNGCLNGSIKYYVRKQPIPENWDKDNVKQLVVDNFNQVFENYKSGVILFYASWCGHCEALMPTWFKVADDMASKYPNIFVAKIDHAENDVSGVVVEGYPTIYAFKSRDQKVLYEGERNYDDIMKFIISTLDLDEDTSSSSSSPSPSPSSSKDRSEL